MTKWQIKNFDKLMIPGNSDVSTTKVDLAKAYDEISHKLFELENE